MEALPKIRSFSVDHDRLLPGLYVSRVDGDAVTYDLRMRRPNGAISPKLAFIGWKSPVACAT